MVESSFKHLIYEKEGKIAWITLNRPEKLNALNRVLWHELGEALDLAEKDEDVYAIAVTGAGRAFCAGDDIAELNALQTVKDAYNLFLNDIFPIVKKFLVCSKPIIAAVNGLAYGGGCEIVMLCDLAIAVENTKFAQPEGRIGVFPPIASVFAPYLIGRKTTAKLLFTGEPMDAKEALEVGLINQIVSAEKLKDAVRELVEKMLTVAPISAKLIKKDINRQLVERLEDLKDSLHNMVLVALQSEDYKEGTAAFLAKRKPVWKGK